MSGPTEKMVLQSIHIKSIESWRLVVLGTPQSFTQTLTDIGYNVVHTMPFGDHHNFENDDVVDIWKEAFAHQADAICITEKDAVKLSQLHAIEDLKCRF